MNPIINTMLMSVGDREFLLVDVCKSTQNIGTCIVTGHITGPGERQPSVELFYIGDETVVTMVKPSATDRHSNKVITQVGSVTDDNIKNRLSVASDNYFTYNQSLIKSLQPVLEILTTGLYVCHVSKMIPSDGGGNYFWNAYNTRHEVTGSSEYNSLIGDENNFIPCFLIPSSNIADYSDAKVRAQSERLKQNKQIGGVAYHLTGMFSVLLDGHHSATACLMNDSDFNCLVIEPIRNVLFENKETAMDNNREPRAIALSCPFVKIPIGAIPEAMTENFFLKRRHEKPANYDILKSKSNRTIRAMSKSLLSKSLYLKAELLPDCAMIESAHAISELSEEQLNALLAGETKYNDQVIISNNYYNSIVTACNFLQYSDFNRFIAFSLNILRNPDLTATHKYVVDRLSNVMNEEVYNFLKEMISEENKTHIELIPIAENYIRRYETAITEQQRELKKTNKIKAAMQKVDSEMGANELAQMEAFIKRTKGSNRPN